MGSPPGEPGAAALAKTKQVTLTKGFWMAKYEATQGNWRASWASCRAR